MKIVETKYRCGKHGFYEPDFEREIDGHVCPRIMCLQCEEESMSPDFRTHPKNVPYFYDGDMKVILQEAHNLSGVWKFNPPVVYPEFSFAEDLSPVVPEDALTSEEIMERMEDLLPEVERLAKEGGVKIPDPRDMVIMPGRNLRVGDAS